MKASPIAIFAAGFIAGGIVLGGALAHARIVMINAAIAGVLPGGEGSLFCVTSANILKPGSGVQRNTTLRVQDSQAISHGVTLRCAS